MSNRPAYSTETFLPLLIGLAVGFGLVAVLGGLPTKWGVFLVVGSAAAGVLLLVGAFTTHLRGAMLFLAVLGLPTFYSITFQFRELVPFTVLANGFPVSITDVFLAPLVVGWLYRIMTDPQQRQISFPKDWLWIIVLLLVINLASCLFVSRIPFFSLSMLYIQAKMYFIMFFLANYLKDEHDFRVMGYAFAAVLLFEGLVVMEQGLLGVIFTQENMRRAVGIRSLVAGGGGTIYRAAGTLSHPNDMAMYINLCLPLVAFMYAIEKKLVRKIFLMTCILIGVYALMASGSRGAWLGMGVGFAAGIFFWLRKQGKNPLFGMTMMFFSVVFVFIALFLTSATFQNRIIKGDREAAQVRIPLMEVATEMIQANPALGVGLNLYTREMVPYDRTNYMVTSSFPEPVHNTFLLVAAETGLPAMALLCVFIILAFKKSVRVAREGDGIVSVIGLGVLTSLICWLVHNQVNHSTVYGDATFYVLLGMLAAAVNYLNQQQLAGPEALPPPSSRA